jgi:hypothetical protein
MYYTKGFPAGKAYVLEINAGFLKTNNLKINDIAKINLRR